MRVAVNENLVRGFAALTFALLVAGGLACSRSETRPIDGASTAEELPESGKLPKMNPEKARAIEKLVDEHRRIALGQKPPHPGTESADTALYEEELTAAAERVRELIRQSRFDARGFGEEVVSARTPGPEVDRWTTLAHTVIDDANGMLDELTADDDVWDEPKYVRDGFKNIRRALRGLAMPPGVKLRLPPGADPRRPPISYVPGRASRDGWLDTADFQLDLMVRAFDRDRP